MLLIWQKEDFLAQTIIEYFPFEMNFMKYLGGVMFFLFGLSSVFGQSDLEKKKNSELQVLKTWEKVLIAEIEELKNWSCKEQYSQWNLLGIQKVIRIWKYKTLA